MALEGAYLYTNQKLHGKPDVRLQRSDHNGEPFVIVDLSGGYSGTYVRVHAAATAAAHMAAFYEAVRLLDPAGASDALLDLIDDDTLTVILARAREAEDREALAAPGEPEPPRLLTIEQAAAMLGCSKMHIYRLATAGELTLVDIAQPGAGTTKSRISPDDLDAFIGRRTSAAACEDACPDTVAHRALTGTSVTDLPLAADRPTRTCARCGITSASVPMLPLTGEDGFRCWSAERCAERAAAKAGAR